MSQVPPRPWPKPGEPVVLIRLSLWQRILEWLSR
jgi:hypothetical protein